MQGIWRYSLGYIYFYSVNNITVAVNILNPGVKCSTQIIQTWGTVSLNYKCPLHDYPRASTNTSFTKSCHIYAIFVGNEVIWSGLLRAIIQFTNVFINDVIYTLAYGTIIARHHTLCQAFCPGFLECVRGASSHKWNVRIDKTRKNSLGQLVYKEECNHTIPSHKVHFSNKKLSWCGAQPENNKKRWMYW